MLAASHLGYFNWVKLCSLASIEFKIVAYKTFEGGPVRVGWGGLVGVCWFVE